VACRGDFTPEKPRELEIFSRSRVFFTQFKWEGILGKTIKNGLPGGKSSGAVMEEIDAAFALRTRIPKPPPAYPRSNGFLPNSPTVWFCQPISCQT
jgi:hypothetical protein